MRRFVLLLACAAMAAVAAPAYAQKTGIVLGMSLEPPHLDPTAGAAAAIDEVLYANVFEGLTRIDAQGEVVPALAREWRISEDGLTYEFLLRDNVTFHDGTAMDADAVVFSLERAMAEDSVNAQKILFEPIETVEASGPLAVTLTLKRPTGHMLFNLGWGDAVVVAPESAAENRSQPVGTGPFRFARWVSGDRVELVRYENYWGEPASLDTATFKFIADPAAAIAALMAGDLDAFPSFPAPEGLPQFEADGRFAVVVGSTEGETILSMNNGREPFDDPGVRKAISHAIDRQAIIDAAMFGYGAPIGSHFAPHHPAYVDLTGMYRHDPEAARALLAEAGLGDGFRATLKLPPPPYARRSGEVVADELRRVGIELEIVPMEWAQWLEQVFQGKDFDLTIISHTEPMDIEIYARDDYYFDYHSDRLRETMTSLSAATSQDDRYRLMGEAQRTIAEDAPVAFLFQLAKLGVWDARLQGLWENSPIQANDLTGVRWAE